VSPRAAWRLESIGFEQVYDYVAGKADWGSYGLPLEGTKGPRASEYVRANVPTCRLEERLERVRTRTRTSGWETCIVVNEANVVLGRLGRRVLTAEDDASVEEAMSAGPSTVRPSIEAAELGERLRRQQVQTALVTTPDGRLVGIVLADDLERASARAGGAD